jgi:hypothetical protein
VSTVDPYLVLGVERGADATTIQRAYRRLAWRHHPDRGGSTARMRELNAAYVRLRAAAACRVAPDPRGRPGQARPGHASTGAHPGPAGQGGETFAAPRPRVRSWLVTTRFGQWVVTVALGLAIHAVAIWSTAPGSRPLVLEALTSVLALRFQASAAPPGRSFAPTRDLCAAALLVVRTTGRIASRW